MPVVQMYIEKFGKEVQIDADHPLAIAQREANKRESVGEPADVLPPELKPVVETLKQIPEVVVPPAPAATKTPKKHKKNRR